MKIRSVIISLFIVAISIVAFGYYHFSQTFTLSKSAGADIRDGDIIFQSTNSPQCKAIQLATRSQYSHCGVIFKEGDKLMVWEAIQPVKKTPLKEFIARGEHGHYVIKRVKNSEKLLVPPVLKMLKAQGEKFMGREYDLYFSWSDTRIYCSELVWKMYFNATGLRLGNLQKMKDFDLSNPLVKQQLKERYGDNIPYDEDIISPAAMFNSGLLMMVDAN